MSARGGAGGFTQKVYRKLAGSAINAIKIDWAVYLLCPLYARMSVLQIHARKVCFLRRLRTFTALCDRKRKIFCLILSKHSIFQNARKLSIRECAGIRPKSAKNAPANFFSLLKMEVKIEKVVIFDEKSYCWKWVDIGGLIGIFQNAEYFAIQIQGVNAVSSVYRGIFSACKTKKLTFFDSLEGVFPFFMCFY